MLDLALFDALAVEILLQALALAVGFPALCFAAAESSAVLGGAALRLGSLFCLAEPVEIDDRCHYPPILCAALPDRQRMVPTGLLRNGGI